MAGAESSTINPAELASDSQEALDALERRVEPLLASLSSHPLYSQLSTLASLRLFMEHHVFAVWDFMSLLKGLQQQLTRCEVPWYPVGNRAVRRLINQIVLEEESDLGSDGEPASHLEMYLDAMTQAGASTDRIQQLLRALTCDTPVDEALVAIPDAAARFCRQTFAFLEDGRPHILAAAFTVGREEAIPRMFVSLVENLSQQSDRLAPFAFYLQRHIELDGDQHSEQGREMLRQLCGTDKAMWLEAYQASETSLRARLQLWDDVMAHLAAASAS